MIKGTTDSRIFNVFNYFFLICTAIICLFPLVNVLSISFSTNAAVSTGKVTLLPVEFTASSYQYVMNSKQFIVSFLVSVRRVFLGVSINMLLNILLAYPLSLGSDRLRFRNTYVWFFIITMLFRASIIPQYIIVRETGLIDKIWALVIPSAVIVFNVILLHGFFRELPKELGESAFIDGAGHWTILWKVYVPLSKPTLATLTLFSFVFHWNQWFDGLIYMNNMGKYPLQSYLQTIVTRYDPEMFNKLSSEDLMKLSQISDRTVKAAQIFIAAIPVFALYPFLQKYFVTGLTLGSVKG